MYHVAMGVAPEDDQLAEKVGTLADLPAATESVRVTLLHIPEEGESVEAVPEVARGLELLEDAGVAAEAMGIDGETPTEALVDAVEELDPDLVVVGGRRRSPAGKLQLKAGAQQVILRLETPVMVAGTADGTELRT